MGAKESYKLYNSLKTLSKKEVRQFKRVLQSPFFTLRNDMYDLFECLAKKHLEGKLFPAREEIFQQVYPKKEYDYVLLRAAMSDLFKLLEEYLLILKRRSDKIKTQHLLAEIYRERRLKKCYQTVVKNTATILETQPLRNKFYFRQLLDFQLEEMELNNSNQNPKISNVKEISESIDILYLVQKLKHTCHQFTHQRVVKTDYDFGLLNHLIHVIEDEKYLKLPAISIYYYCYRFLTEQNGQVFFQKFKELLFQNKEIFDVREFRELYIMAINFGIRKLNQGDKHFGFEILELYKEGLQEGYFLENGILSRFTFINIVSTGIYVKEFDWVEEFIASYAEKLGTEYEESIVSFNFAKLEYARKNYGKAMLYLQNVEYKDLVNNLVGKTMLMKIYYELGEYDALVSHLDSFQIFIRRREVSDFHRSNFMNIIRWVKRLIAIPDLDKKTRIQLKEEILAEKNLSEREWLLEKITK